MVEYFWSACRMLGREKVDEDRPRELEVEERLGGKYGLSDFSRSGSWEGVSSTGEGSSSSSSCMRIGVSGSSAMVSGGRRTG